MDENTQTDEELTKGDIEQKLRDVIAWARRRTAELRNDNPPEGRAAAIIATHTEEALYRLLWPVP